MTLRGGKNEEKEEEEKRGRSCPAQQGRRYG
jgi:hypothetical protein